MEKERLVIADILHKILLMEAEPNRPYYPRPSLAGPERCLRQIVYWAKGETSKGFAGRMLQVLSDSSWGEETTADLIRKSAFQLHSEQMDINLRGVLPWMPNSTWRCNVCGKDVPHRDLHGHIDYILSDMLDRDYLCDHKSINHFSHQRYCGEAVPLDYFYQLAIYARGLQEYNPGLRGILLLMKNKNTSGYLEFRGEYDTPTDTLRVFEKTFHTGEKQQLDIVIPNITNEAINRFAEIERYRASGVLPERQYAADDWHCEYCSYSGACWQNCEEEHETLTEDVAMEGEIVDLIKYERECARQESEIKEERKKLKEGIKKILKAIGVRKGRAGDYLIEWKVTKTKRLDTDLIPPGAYKQALVTIPSEKIDIKRIKGEQGK